MSSTKKQLKSEAARYKAQMMKEITHMADALDSLLDIPEAVDFLAKAEAPVVKISISLADGTHFTADERVLTP